ncbi:uncharacterized protein LOC112523625 isoform X2 [Cynara cardunculus var. scolymus]|uniref:uncharacterized protein LOC112523625 isoform X2 n=1 Tax=Cynara cardunculus var. scolymus TaxID=59895 RepID=UPI000D62C5DA|nr:uncharacterized protein LOC112523625 isoform X2 [Cynara cardunculus var. scolymus]
MPLNSGREMTWCSHCGKNCETSRDYTTNNTSCVDCGKVLFEDIFTEEATFVTDAAGGAHLTGNFVRFGGACFESQRRTLRKGNVATNKLIYKNRITKVSHATRHYKGRETIWCPHCARKGGTAHDRTTSSVHCVDCGKVLFEEIYTENATFFRDAAGGVNQKDERKQALDAKHLKPVQTASEAAGQLSLKKMQRSSSKINYDVLNTLFGGNEPNPMNCSYAIGKEPMNGDDETEEDDYSETEWRSYDNEQESCSYDYDYDYDYDAGDENDDY